MRPLDMEYSVEATRLWLLEGLPGTGKTSAARRLAELCDEARLAARWWPEEAKDHPATPAALRRQSAHPDFAGRCVSSFRDLVHLQDGVLILDGSALQSTVRFMFAQGWRDERIAAYVAEWSRVVAVAQPRLLLFRVGDLPKHFDQVVAIRGRTWSSKLTSYVERTPVALTKDWRGSEGFLQFWAAYQSLAFEMAAEANCPVLELRGWSAAGGGFAADEAFAFLVR